MTFTETFIETFFIATPLLIVLALAYVWYCILFYRKDKK